MSIKCHISLAFGILVSKEDLKKSGLEDYPDEDTYPKVAIGRSFTDHSKTQSYLWARDSHREVFDGYTISVEAVTPLGDLMAAKPKKNSPEEGLVSEDKMTADLLRFCEEHNLPFVQGPRWLLISGWA